jgi:hypothetical protein
MLFISLFPGSFSSAWFLVTRISHPSNLSQQMQTGLALVWRIRRRGRGKPEKRKEMTRMTKTQMMMVTTMTKIVRKKTLGRRMARAGPMITERIMSKIMMTCETREIIVMTPTMCAT